MENKLRIIDDTPKKGSLNMALDEAILCSIINSAADQTVRFYSWSSPCLSIGRNQRISEVSRQALMANKIDIVRRPTGGSAVLHDKELTYSVSMKIPKNTDGSIVATCRLIHDAISKALKDIGISSEMQPEIHHKRVSNPVCFANASDTEIISDGVKAIGSAQMRKSGCLMQHGSIPFSLDADKLISLFSINFQKDQANLTKGLSFTEQTEAFKNQIVKHLSESMMLKPYFGSYTDEELKLADGLEHEKYLNTLWTERR